MPSRRYLRLALGLLGAVSAIKPLRESDLHWHLSLGRAVWRAHARTVPEPAALLALGATRHVPEWLWDVTTYGLWQLGGAAALTALIAACGAAIGALAWDVIDGDEEHPIAPSLLAVGIALPVLFFRLRERPESLVTALALATFLQLRRWAKHPDRPQAALALGVVGVTWAQVHSTAVLLPAMCAIAFAPALRSRESLRALGGRNLAALVLLALTPFTGATGFGLIAQLRAHAGGDAVEHIRDMVPTTWAHLNVVKNHVARSFIALLAVGVAGALAEGRLRPRRLGLAALGVAVAAAAGRGLALGGVLLLPFAAAGARALWAHLALARFARATWAAGAVTAGLVALSAAALHDRQGPVGSIGEPPLQSPLAAAHVLRELPAGAAVYSSFGASASLGWALDGRQRTFVDSRTPMHFDDTQFAVSRDVGHASDPRLAFARYDFRAVVIERSAALCAWTQAAPGWRPVAVVGAWAVFAHASVLAAWPALRGLDPCRTSVAAPERCAEAVTELGAHERWLPAAEAATLRAELAQACPGSLEGPRALPPIPVSGEARALLLRLHAREALRGGRHDEAARHTLALIEEGRIDLLPQVAPAFVEAGRSDLARAVMAEAAVQLDQATSADLRAELATLLARAGDAEGARFHGIRAAALGSTRVGPVLRWLVRRHPDAAVRADAAAWERVVRAAEAGARSR